MTFFHKEVMETARPDNPLQQIEEQINEKVESSHEKITKSKKTY